MDITNMGGDTPLHSAVAHGHKDIVAKVCVLLGVWNVILTNSCIQMLQVQPHINAVNEHGNSPLHYACFFGYESLCEVSLYACLSCKV